MNCETCRYSGYGWHENECSRPTTECSYQPIEQHKSETKELKKELNNSNDAISRQGAIDDLELTIWYHQNRNGEMVKGANSKEDQAWYKAEDVYKVLKDAPSVQPEVLACGSGELNVQSEPYQKEGEQG